MRNRQRPDLAVHQDRPLPVQRFCVVLGHVADLAPCRFDVEDVVGVVRNHVVVGARAKFVSARCFEAGIDEPGRVLLMAPDRSFREKTNGLSNGLVTATGAYLIVLFGGVLLYRWATL